jgi:hypothetical protein
VVRRLVSCDVKMTQLWYAGRRLASSYADEAVLTSRTGAQLWSGQSDFAWRDYPAVGYTNHRFLVF